jgi:hypothetical protein
MALGASRRDVVSMIIVDAMKLFRHAPRHRMAESLLVHVKADISEL